MRRNQDLLVTVLATLAVAFFLARFLAVSSSLPYYFIFDMDEIAAVDTMLIGSGSLPDHINHPAFGMYLAQVNSERLAHGAGLISAKSLGELSASLNPLAVMAELTTYLRRNTPFVEVLAIVMLWAAAVLVLRPPRWIALLFLIILGMQESFLYHASMIRTELYALLYWSAALLAMAIATRVRKAGAYRVGLLVAGVFCGLCFLTKIQSLFHLAAFVLLTVLSFSICGTGVSPVTRITGETPVPQRNARLWVILAWVNFGVFVALALAVIAVRVPVGYAAFTDSFKYDKNPKGFDINPITILFFLAALTLAGVQTYLTVKRKDIGDAEGREEKEIMNVRAKARTPNKQQAKGSKQPTTHNPQLATLLFLIASSFTLIFSGFLAAFLTHFLMFANPATSLTYLLYDFKMIFMREISSQQNFPYIIVNPLGFLAYHPVLFAVHFGLLLALAAGYFKKFAAIPPLELGLCGALSLLALAILWLSVRYFQRDLLWEETLLNLLNFYYFMLVWRRVRVQAPRVRAAAVAALLLALGVSALHGLAMTRRIDMNYNTYGWTADKWRSNVAGYDYNQKKYAEAMRNFYGDGPQPWEAARAAAVNQAFDRNAAEFVFQNQPVTQRQVGVASEGFPVWINQPEARIVGLSPALRGGIVVDSRSLPLKNKYFSNRDKLTNPKQAESMDKFKAAPAAGLLSVLPRADLRVLLFVQPEDLKWAQFEDSAPTQLQIAVGTGPQQQVTLTGFEITNYAEIPVSAFTREYFFVLLRK